ERIRSIINPTASTNTDARELAVATQSSRSSSEPTQRVHRVFAAWILASWVIATPPAFGQASDSGGKQRSDAIELWHGSKQVGTFTNRLGQQAATPPLTEIPDASTGEHGDTIIEAALYITPKPANDRPTTERRVSSQYESPIGSTHVSQRNKRLSLHEE